MLVSTGDGRHILETLGSAADQPSEIFVSEPNLTLYARQMLFIYLFLDDSIATSEKPQMFLELFGNTMIRPDTRRFVRRTSRKLMRLITGDRDKLICGCIDVSKLKFKEIDGLEGIFRLWASTDTGVDMPALWDSRLKLLLKQRYSSKVTLNQLFPNWCQLHYQVWGASTLRV